MDICPGVVFLSPGPSGSCSAYSRVFPPFSEGLLMMWLVGENTHMSRSQWFQDHSWETLLYGSRYFNYNMMELLYLNSAQFIQLQHWHFKGQLVFWGMQTCFNGQNILYSNDIRMLVLVQCFSPLVLEDPCPAHSSAFPPFTLFSEELLMRWLVGENTDCGSRFRNTAKNH